MKKNIFLLCVIIVSLSGTVFSQGTDTYWNRAVEYLARASEILPESYSIELKILDTQGNQLESDSFTSALNPETPSQISIERKNSTDIAPQMDGSGGRPGNAPPRELSLFI